MQRVPQHRPSYLPSKGQRRLAFDRQRNTNDAWRAFINSVPWRKCAKSYLRSHPLCARCLADNRFVAATEIHHTRGQAEEFKFDHDFLEALCTSCHSTITLAELKGGKRTSASKITNVDE